MTINVVNRFKFWTPKTFEKTKIGQDLHAAETFPSVDVRLYSGKKIFKFGTTTTVVDDNISKPKSLEHVEVAQSSSLFDACADIHVGRQKNILSKVKPAKNSISKLFKLTGRISAPVPYIGPFATPSVEHGTMNDYTSSLSPPSTLQYAMPKACVVTTYESILPHYTSSEAIGFPIAYGENVVDGRMEDLASTPCNLVEASFLSATGQPFAIPRFQLNTLPLPSFLRGLHTIEEEDRSTELTLEVVNTKQNELAISCSYTSSSNSNSEVTVYFSSDALSDYTTANVIDLIGSDINTSPVDTSFATSVDAGDSHQSSPRALRVLRRVPNYEDLRNLRVIANRGLSSSDISCGSFDFDFSGGETSSINAAPLHKSTKCDHLRRSFLSFESNIYTPSTRIDKYRKFRAWLSTGCHESSCNAQKTSVAQEASESQRITPVSRSRQLLQGIIRLSSCVRAQVLKPSSLQPSPPSPPVWSCAKITRSSSKAKTHRRMMRQSTRELKVRLESVDIDLWYSNADPSFPRYPLALFPPS